MSKTIHIRKTLEASWQLTRDTKAAIWMPSLVAIIISVLVAVLVHGVSGTTPSKQNHWTQFFLQPIIANFFSAPFFAGAIMIGVKKLRNEKIELTSGLQYMRPFIPVAIGFAVITLIMRVPLLLTQAHSPLTQLLGDLLGAILFVFLFLTVPLITDKKCTPLQAITQAINITMKQWHRIFAVFICLYLVGLASAIPLALGIHFQNGVLNIIGVVILLLVLFWLLPWTFLCMSVIYEKLTKDDTVKEPEMVNSPEEA